MKIKTIIERDNGKEITICMLENNEIGIDTTAYPFVFSLEESRIIYKALGEYINKVEHNIYKNDQIQRGQTPYHESLRTCNSNYIGAI